MIMHGRTVGFSAFTPAGSVKAIPRAIAERAKTEHAAGRSYQIRVLTGASAGESLDGALASPTRLASVRLLRALINSRQAFGSLDQNLVPCRNRTNRQLQEGSLNPALRFFTMALVWKRLRKP
jgi:acyl-CoA hydrolase